ncbi:MAG: EamA family transporter [Candidatus Gracilibacteria bacterium]|nr:EamA family transporter [Candidatus Gracilibacteria bacterium]
MLVSLIGALFQTIFSGIDNVNYKKSLVYNPGILVFRFFGVLSEGSAAFILALFVKINFSEHLIFWMLMGVAVLNAFAGILGQRAYTEEKISVLMPYSKVDAVIIVIVSFFLFKDVSVFSFAVCMLILAITIGANIDFKNFKMSKPVLYVIISKIIYGIGGIVCGYALKHITAYDFFVYDRVTFVIVLIISMLLFATKLKKEDFVFPKQFYVCRYISSYTRMIGYFIGLLLISELGLVMSTILGFLQMAVLLVMSYFMLGDKPSKRDLVLTGIVTVLVFIGLYFR